MTAASRPVLEDIARRSCGVMPACRTTQGQAPGPTWSTFRRAIRGGASWVWGAPDGTIYLLRGSPRGVVLRVQSWANATPDGKWGTNTQRAVLARLGEAYTAPMTAPLMERILQAAFHPEGGNVVLPQSVELPVPEEPHVLNVPGDASFFERVRLADGTVATPNTRTSTWQPTGQTAQVDTEVHRVVVTEEQRVAAPVQAAPSPTAAAAPTGVRVSGAPGGVRVWAQPASGGTAVELTGSPLSAVTGAGPQRLSLETREGARTYEVTVPLGVVLEVSWQLLAAGAPIEKCILACEQGRTDEAARIPGCSCGLSAPVAPPERGTAPSALEPSTGIPTAWIVGGAALAALGVAWWATKD